MVLISRWSLGEAPLYIELDGAIGFPCHIDRSFLKDLVETSHLFLKMLEHFTCNANLVVLRKRKKMRKRKQTAQPQQTVESMFCTLLGNLML